MSFYCEYSGEVSKGDWEKIEESLRRAASDYDIEISYDDGVLTVSTETDTDVMINDELELAGLLERADSHVVLVYSEDEGAGLKQEGVISRMGIELLNHEKAVAEMRDAVKAAMREELSSAPAA